MRSPDRIVTSLTPPSRISAWAFTTPATPSCSALRGISGFTWVAQATLMSLLAPFAVALSASITSRTAGDGSPSVATASGRARRAVSITLDRPSALTKPRPSAPMPPSSPGTMSAMRDCEVSVFTPLA